MFCAMALAAITLAHVHSAAGFEVAVYYPPLRQELPAWRADAPNATQRAGYLVIAPLRFFMRDREKDQ
jgi:hypothetical protein